MGRAMDAKVKAKSGNDKAENGNSNGKAASDKHKPSSDSLSSFLAKVQQAHNDLGRPDEVWYRGQANKDWALLPGLHRFQGAIDREAHAYRQWVRRAELIDKSEGDEWQHLFNMQHYGVPTRLLDWSESFAISLGFSLVFSGYGELSVPRVFMLNPVSLNEITTGRRKVFEIPDPTTLSYRQIYLDGQGIMPRGPVAIRPSSYSRNNRRADNQASVFTLHDNKGAGLENIGDKIVSSFTIKKEDIPGARQFLKLANINEYTIYPDFGGLARYVRAVLTSETK